MNERERIQLAVAHTQVIRPPEQLLATFGQTNIHYYLLTEPVYSEIQDQSATPETVLREGRVLAEQPKLVTPMYLQRLEGFGEEARRYFDMVASHVGPNAPGLLYTYKNEPGELSILSGSLPAVAERINADITRRNEKKAAIIRGLDELWDVSLLKFIYQLTENSIGRNVYELRQHGLLGIDRSGVPAEARLKIEEMFIQLVEGSVAPSVVKDELDRWNLFEEYQDRFFAALRKSR